jgi:hypothetical protein
MKRRTSIYSKITSKLCVKISIITIWMASFEIVDLTLSHLEAK